MKYKISNFQGFLKDDEKYKSNVDFWKSKIHEIEPDFKDWMSNHYMNGEEINDGNPLIAVRYNNIAIRIIQTEKNNLQPKFASWIKKYNEFNLTELVVCIQPDPTVYTSTEFLIKLFYKNKYRRFQNKMNLRYNKILNSNRTHFLLNKLEPISASANIIKSNMELNREAFKIVRAVSQKLRPNESIFRNAKISKPYNSSIQKASQITAQISVLRVLDIKEATKINLDFENLKNQISKLKEEIVVEQKSQNTHR
jgi:hypothetical protein